MSALLMGRVFGLDLPRSERDVLLALADHAHDDGTSARPGVPYLMWKTDLARSTVIAALRGLEEKEIIVAVRAGGGRGKLTEYRLDLEKSPKKRPFLETVRSTGSSPPKPSDSEVESEEETVRLSLARKEQPSLELQPPELQPPPMIQIPIPAKVDRTAVTRVEGSLAVDVLAEWNDQTGQRLTSRDWLSKIVMRIREYPDLTLNDHAHVIAASLAAPWWSGAATPSVVYGSGAQFERSILTAQAGPKDERRRSGPGGGPTPEEMRRRAERLSEEGL